jgi:hypothetical protein
MSYENMLWFGFLITSVIYVAERCHVLEVLVRPLKLRHLRGQAGDKPGDHMKTIL